MPHSDVWCWVPRSELRAEVVMRNKVDTGVNHLDKMIQLQKETLPTSDMPGISVCWLLLQ